MLCRRCSPVFEAGDALPQGIEGGLGAAAEVQLAQDLAHVGADRRFADGELFGDLAVGPAPGDQLQHLDLALGEQRALSISAGRWR